VLRAWRTYLRAHPFSRSYRQVHLINFICINFTVFSEYFLFVLISQSSLGIFYLFTFFAYRILTLPFVHVFDWMAIPLNNISEYFILFLAHVPQYFAHTLTSEYLALSLSSVCIFICFCHRLLRIIFPSMLCRAVSLPLPLFLALLRFPSSSHQHSMPAAAGNITGIPSLRQISCRISFSRSNRLRLCFSSPDSAFCDSRIIRLRIIFSFPTLRLHHSQVCCVFGFACAF